MINVIKTLINKTNSLEESFNNLSSNKIENVVNNNFICFSKGHIDFSFLNSNKFLIAKFETKQNSALYFQNQIELNIPVSQNIKISLIANNIAIYRSTRKLQSGFNQLTIMKSYTPLKSEEVELYLEIIAEDNSLITIISDTLLVWGLSNITSNIEYQAIETNNNFLLSYINNNSIFYKYTNKETISLNSEDFTYYSSAISYSFCYFEPIDKVYLFRVDLDGNLFYCNFNNNYEHFLDSDVSFVSCISNNKLILVSYIKNNSCYTIEINSSFNISSPNKINCDIPFIKTYSYFNKYNKKFYLILTDSKNSNYIVENMDVLNVNHFNINATYSIEVSTYEVSEWI